MKLFMQALALIVFSAMLASTAIAQSPREQLQQLTAQLQKTPNDNALRERIIKLGAEIKPAPAIPDEANRREGRGKFAFRSAKSNEDFLAAAAEFEAAARAAPWVAGYYSDLCTIYEKAEKYAEAKLNCELNLASLADPAQISEVRQRIAGLEFGIEKVATDKRRAVEEANSPKAREAALLSRVEGARFVRRVTSESMGLKPRSQDFDEIFEIRGGVLHYTVKIHVISGGSVRGYRQPGEHLHARISFRDNAFTLTESNGMVEAYTIGADGQALIRTPLRNASFFPDSVGLPPPQTIPRQ